MPLRMPKKRLEVILTYHSNKKRKWCVQLVEQLGPESRLAFSLVLVTPTVSKAFFQKVSDYLSKAYNKKTHLTI